MNKLILCALLVLAVVTISEARKRSGFKRGSHGGHSGEISASEKAFNGERAELRKGNRGKLVRFVLCSPRHFFVICHHTESAS